MQSEGSGGTCPECEEEELGFVLLNNDEGRFVCPKCGFESEQSLNKECSRCGQEYWDTEDDSPMCRGCWSDVMRKND
jgi:hypothetical protein